MTVLVRNDDHDIEMIYENVDHVTSGFGGMFSIRLESGDSATFHYQDEDGSEWECYRIH